MFNRLTTLFIMTAALTSALSACGGGGGGDSAPPSPPPAPPTANVALVSSQPLPNVAVGQQLTVTWSNTDNVSCTGNGLLAGISGASGSTQVAAGSTGAASYSVTCGTATSDEVTLNVLPEWTLISDPVFEQLLINAGVDDTLDGRVKTSAILGVTKLAILSGTGYTQAPDVLMIPCNGVRITDTTGLENFRNLTYLRLEGQAFTAIDVSQLTHLTFLSLWQDPITTLDVSALTQLTTLGTSETALTTLDVSHNTELTELDMQNGFSLPYVLPNGSNVQGLTALDVSHNTKLTLLLASYNRLTTMDLTHNTLLQRAALDHNQLVSVDATGISAAIDTSHNPMTP